MSQIIVHKYGGSSVKDIDRINVVANHVTKTVLEDKKQLVVVVSAMGEHTNELTNLAHQVSSSPQPRELDMLLTVGERITMSLLSMALKERGVNSISLTGSQSGIITNNQHGNAKISHVIGDRIRQGLSDKKVVIVAGFQGMSKPENEITTLGRGGSDLTAIAIAGSIGAHHVEFYKDVKGLYSADPKRIKDAFKIDSVTHETLLALSYSGSKLIHARGALLAKRKNMPLIIRSSYDLSSSGTQIITDKERESKMESSEIVAISTEENMCSVSISSSKSIDIKAYMDHLSANGETPKVFETYYHDDKQIVRFACSAKSAANIEGISKDCSMTISHDLFIITLVGHGLKEDSLLVDKVLSSFKSNPKAIQFSQNNIAILCDKNGYDSSLEKLHKLISK